MQSDFWIDSYENLVLIKNWSEIFSTTDEYESSSVIFFLEKKKKKKERKKNS